MAIEYIEEREGGLYVAGSRVSLASIVFAFQQGGSPETIRQNFPTLNLAQVYGAIAYYLNHPSESQSYLNGLHEKWNRLEAAAQEPAAGMQERLNAAQHSVVPPR